MGSDYFCVAWVTKPHRIAISLMCRCVWFAAHIAIIMFYCPTQPDYQWYAPDQFPPDVQHKANGKTTAGLSILSCLHFNRIFGGMFTRHAFTWTWGGSPIKLCCIHNSNVMLLELNQTPLEKENARVQKCMALSPDFCSHSVSESVFHLGLEIPAGLCYNNNNSKVP